MMDAEHKADKKTESREVKDTFAKLLENEPPYGEIRYFIREKGEGMNPIRSDLLRTLLQWPRYGQHIRKILRTNR